MPSIPFSFECSKEGGFVMDPNEHKRVGYIIQLDAVGLKLAQDLTVAVPYNGDVGYTTMKLTKSGEASVVKGGKAAGGAVGPSTTQAVAVIEKFEWAGGVGDPLKLEFYCSQENAFQIKALQQQALKTTMVSALSWWICDYDQEVKCWFEQSHAKDPFITGLVTGKENPELDVDLNPVVVKDGIDVNVYKITMGVAPAANKAYALKFANSSKMNTMKSWGLVVGNVAKEALPG